MSSLNLYEKYFPKFKRSQISTSDTTINTLIGGQGPPLLLLHGYPQNLFLWRYVAPILANEFTVVLTDLRGYGESGKPDTDAQHSPYSKRAMAQDQIEVMEAFGYKKFYLAGHDRGARVAHRMALDHAHCIEKLAIIDILPTLQLYRETDMNFAKNYWHWFFLIQPYPLPETLLGNNADFMAMAIFAKLLHAEKISPDILHSYKNIFSDSDALRASCEDYRAGATIDLKHDEASLDQRIQCPTLILWGNQNPVYEKVNMLKEWKKRAINVLSESMDSGHFIPEELPQETAAILKNFFK